MTDLLLFFLMELGSFSFPYTLTKINLVRSSFIRSLTSLFATVDWRGCGEESVPGLCSFIGVLLLLKTLIFDTVIASLWRHLSMSGLSTRNSKSSGFREETVLKISELSSSLELEELSKLCSSISVGLNSKVLLILAAKEDFFISSCITFWAALMLSLDSLLLFLERLFKASRSSWIILPSPRPLRRRMLGLGVDFLFMSLSSRIF